MSRTIFVLLTVCLTACASDARSTEAASSTEASPPAMTSAATVQSTEVTPAGTDAFTVSETLIDEIMALPELNRSALETLLETQFRETSTTSPVIDRYAADLPDGPFESLDCKVPKADTEATAHIVLVVRSGVDLPLSAYRKRLLDPAVPVNADEVSSQPTMTYTLRDLPRYELAYRFIVTPPHLLRVTIRGKSP